MDILESIMYMALHTFSILVYSRYMLQFITQSSYQLKSAICAHETVFFYPSNHIKGHLYLYDVCVASGKVCMFTQSDTEIPPRLEPKTYRFLFVTVEIVLSLLIP